MERPLFPASAALALMVASCTPHPAAAGPRVSAQQADASAPKPSRSELRTTRCQEDFEHLLTRVVFFDELLGLAVGGDSERGTPSVVLRTIDGGANWERIETATDRRLYGVAFATRTLAVAVGLGGTLLRSEDSGQSWSSIDLGVNAWLADVAFSSAEVGVLVGTFERAPLLLRTTDGGQSFGTAKLLAPALSDGCRSVAVSGDLALTVGTGGLILRSTDAGASWEEVESGELGWLRAVRFSPDDVVHIVGAGGVLLESRDRGQLWSRMEFPFSEKLNDVCFLDPRHGIVASMQGNLFLSKDAGTSWERARELEHVEIASLARRNERAAYAVGGGLLLELTLE